MYKKKKKIESKLDMKQISLRLRSEFNDLKRTPSSISKELNFPKKKIDCLLSGDFNYTDLYKFLNLMTGFYPINISDLIITKKDTKNGMLFFKSRESKKSSRIFSRKGKDDQFSAYYEYRDTAKSNLSHFYPEWIEIKRFVDDDNAQNPDVIYNNGHFLHQINLFVGPVNFYYEIDNKKYCMKMNTGDSSYISPFIKHTFAKREKNTLAYIVAVTTGSGLKRNQNEFRRFGNNFLKKNILTTKKNFNFFKHSLKQAQKNEIISDIQLSKMLGAKTIKKIENEKNFNDITLSEIEKIANSVNVSVSELLANYQNDGKVTNKFFNKKEYIPFPDKKKISYKIYRIAKSNNFFNLKGFLINVTSNRPPKLKLEFSLNLYVFNYGENDLLIDWQYKDKFYKSNLKKGDSIYIEPFIKFSFSSLNKNSWVYLVTSETGVDTETKKELSSIHESIRLIQDENQWFHGKKGE